LQTWSRFLLKASKRQCPVLWFQLIRTAKSYFSWTNSLMTWEKRHRAKDRGNMPNFKRFQQSFPSHFHAKRRCWYSSLGESINPSNAWSVIRRITGGRRKWQKGPPPPSVQTSYIETCA
jgi:hypothetical protein